MNGHYIVLLSVRQSTNIVERVRCWFECSSCRAGFLEEIVSGRCAACVTATRCDTASTDEAAAVLGAGARRVGVPPITSVINSGGVLADAILTSQTAGTMQSLVQSASEEILCSPPKLFLQENTVTTVLLQQLLLQYCCYNSTLTIVLLQRHCYSKLFTKALLQYCVPIFLSQHYCYNSFVTTALL